MSNPRILQLIMTAALAASAAPAQSGQPPDVVGSDAASNTAMGGNALLNLTSGIANTAAGAGALFSNTTGGNNTAFGAAALHANSAGELNVAVGYQALFGNTVGTSNTAVGLQSLYANTSGSGNTAYGLQTLFQNSSGADNTAVGYEALVYNTTGGFNTSFGYQAMYFNSTGYQNTAVGLGALYHNSTGFYNTGTGYGTLFLNTTGGENTATGFHALYNATGSNNIGEGFHGGFNLTNGSNNIDIGNVGAAADNGIIRIGTAGTHNAAYVAGIAGAKVTGAAVYVTASGQLGVLASSERYKTAVAPMGADSDKLGRLRPVTFRLKSDPLGAVQYGLIAEEVDRVYPDLVIRDEAGRIEGVRYDELAPLLLNEVQKQRRVARAQAARSAAQDVQMRDMQRQITELRRLNDALQAGLAGLRRGEEPTVMR
jgi:hypothetical protein